MKLEGSGFAQDKREAVRYFKLASEQGLTEAQYNLGLIYERGDGVPADAEAAVHQFTLASHKDEFMAMVKLALACISGTGTEVDHGRAVDLLWRPARKGIPEAQFLLGYLLINEMGKENDTKEGIKFMSEAAVNGMTRAQHYMGVCFQTGHGGLGQDHGEAIKWFQAAAKAGNGESMYSLYEILSKGKGMERQAEKWLKQAAEKGVPAAADRLREFSGGGASK
mmetsp:Transcript_15150/g.23593  ORF Transcript_15150/g.23593 Transcript_15150/m.23593 type:complete len:223 (+) Transcript_15150:328-996(+)